MGPVSGDHHRATAALPGLCLQECLPQKRQLQPMRVQRPTTNAATLVLVLVLVLVLLVLLVAVLDPVLKLLVALVVSVPTGR